ncbi:MAG: TonB-dependent receptor [Ignavibacteriae bacterium]|nr:TonB-dependent receptor [Ignavibacteriota bacterium]
MKTYRKAVRPAAGGLKFKVLLLISVFFLFNFGFSIRADAQEAEDTNTYRTPTIEVDAIKGIEKVVPIVLETVKKEAIEKRYWMQDLPMFLSGSTNIYAYSESGASVGYSYFTIRGFDQRRLSILLNGTPQNDPMDHQVNWVELSDITSSIENIQIQRGISTALFGTSGIGGVVNLQTIDYFKNKFINLNAGYGAYNSKRFSAEYSSGLTQGGFGFYGKFSKTKTDGYRNLSWSDHWSYFLSAGKILGESSVIKLNIYGSPVKNHTAYKGITKRYLDGQVTGDIRTDRRYNPIEYINEVSDFFQPHYELVYNLQAAKTVFISNTFNYIRRDGFFTTNYPISAGYDLHHFRLPYFYARDTFTYNINYYLRNQRGRIDTILGLGYTVARTDLVAKLNTKSNDYGWFPKVHIRHTGDIGNLLIGGEFRLHRSENCGEIDFANALPPGTPDDYKYYFYKGNKNTYSIYLNEFTNMAKKLSGMFGIQFTYHKYSVDNSAYTPYNFDVDYKFLTSRVGFNYNFNEYFRAFVNASIARREPRLSDLYDGTSLTAKPNFKTIDTVNRIYRDPLVTYEEMNDYELGFGYGGSLLRANLNFYRMDYTNEIVSNGQLDIFGQPMTWNAGKSVHQGIEIEFEYNMGGKFQNGKAGRNPEITLSGNLSLTDNYFITYLEKNYIDSLGNIYGNDYSGNQILLNPQIIGNLLFNYNSEIGLSGYIAMQYIGKQYLDNSENERKNPERRNAPGYVDKIINAHTVFNAGISLDLIPLFKSDRLGRFFRTLEVSFRINNIFDVLYESTGGMSANGVPLWIPAADRNLFFNMRVGF